MKAYWKHIQWKCRSFLDRFWHWRDNQHHHKIQSINFQSFRFYFSFVLIVIVSVVTVSSIFQCVLVTMSSKRLHFQKKELFLVLLFSLFLVLFLCMRRTVMCFVSQYHYFDDYMMTAEYFAVYLAFR